MPNVADDAVADLFANPRTFLGANALVIYSGNRASGQENFVLSQTVHQWRSIVGGDRAVPLWVMYFDGSYNGQAEGAVSAAFATHYVSMRQYNPGTASWEGADQTHYVLPTAAGPDRMVTSKLNGCTFGVGSAPDGSAMVSHLRPPGMPEGRMLLNQGTEAGFGGGGHLRTRIMSSGEQNATVVGIRAAGAWTIFAQRFQMLANATGIIDGVQRYG